MFDIISREIQGFFKSLFDNVIDLMDNTACMYCQQHDLGIPLR